MLCSGLRARAQTRGQTRAQSAGAGTGAATGAGWKAWGVARGGEQGEVQVAGSFGCPLGENPPPQFGKHLVKRLTHRGKVATFRAMKSTELVRVLITEGRH